MHQARLRRGVAMVLTAALFLGGCASEVVRTPTELKPTQSAEQRTFWLASTVSFSLPSGYERTIAANTEFVSAGRIGQGAVLRPTKTVLTVEGKHMHEAYVVLDNDRLVGFYLPVERAFSALPQAIPFPLSERKT